jgi:hypothetical protein
MIFFGEKNPSPLQYFTKRSPNRKGLLNSLCTIHSSIRWPWLQEYLIHRPFVYFSDTHARTRFFATRAAQIPIPSSYSHDSFYPFNWTHPQLDRAEELTLSTHHLQHFSHRSLCLLFKGNNNSLSISNTSWVPSFRAL